MTTPLRPVFRARRRIPSRMAAPRGTVPRRLAPGRTTLPTGSAAAGATPFRVFAVALAILAAVPATALAAQDARDPEERGTALVRAMDQRARGWGDFEARLTMEIYEGGDDPRQREMRVQGLESQEGDRTLVVLERPADLAGTAFLSVLQADGDRAQWIYLPSRRRARRISGSQSSDPFLGSHFTYGDLDPPTLEGYRFRWLRDGDSEGRSAAVVERTRIGAPGGARELLWIDPEEALLRRVEYRNAGGELDRTLVLSDYRTVDGFPRPTTLEMRAGDGPGRTVLRWSDLRIGVGLSARDFDPRRLGG